MDELSLAKLVGQRVAVKLGGAPHVVMALLRGVEAGGIWIESEYFMEQMFKETPVKMTEKSIVVFVPYAGIVAIYDFAAGQPWISENLLK